MDQKVEKLKYQNWKSNYHQCHRFDHVRVIVEQKGGFDLDITHWNNTRQGKWIQASEVSCDRWVPN